MALRIDYELDQGATFRREQMYLEPDQVTPIPQAGDTARMKVRQADGTEVWSDPDLGIDFETGAITLLISDEATAAFPVETLNYDVELALSSGEVDRVSKGFLYVDPEVTY